MNFNISLGDITIGVCVLFTIALFVITVNMLPNATSNFDSKAAQERIRIYKECVGTNTDHVQIRDHCNQLVNQ